MCFMSSQATRWTLGANPFSCQVSARRPFWCPHPTSFALFIAHLRFPVRRSQPVHGLSSANSRSCHCWARPQLLVCPPGHHRGCSVSSNFTTSSSTGGSPAMALVSLISNAAATKPLPRATAVGGSPFVQCFPLSVFSQSSYCSHSFTQSLVDYHSRFPAASPSAVDSAP
jgi:hypothetical protein